MQCIGTDCVSTHFPGVNASLGKACTCAHLFHELPTSPEVAKLILVTFPLFVYFMEVLVDHNLGDKKVLEALTWLLQCSKLNTVYLQLLGTPMD